MLHDRWIEQLSFAIEVFDERGNLLEVLARLHDLDAAIATHDACRAKYPGKQAQRGSLNLHTSCRSL